MAEKEFPKFTIMAQNIESISYEQALLVTKDVRIRNLLTGNI